MQRPLSLVLIGNYGAGNAGDDALRDAFLHEFPDAQWAVLSATPSGPSEYARLPAGFRSFLGIQWLRTLRVLRTADAVVFGGGTLLTDIESVHACFLWWLHSRAAALFGVPVLFAAQGIGPFHTRIGAWFARDALRRAACISVRDAQSADRVKILIMNKKIVQTKDPVFLFFRSKKQDEKIKNVFIIIPRLNSTASFVESAIQKAKEADAVRIVLLQPHDPDERLRARQIQASLPGAMIVPAPSMAELADALADANLVMTQRYHGAIAAIGMGVPCIAVPQSPGDKIDEIRPIAESADPAVRLECIDDAQRGMDALREALVGLTAQQ